MLLSLRSDLIPSPRLEALAMTGPSAPPTDLRAHQSEQALELVYPDLGSVRVPYRDVRAVCPCAVCQNEWTGERILDPATIPADIKLEAMEPVGNYAIRLRWSDGHSTGIYSWNLWRNIAEERAGAGS